MFRRKYSRLGELTDRLIYLLERINLTGYIEYLEDKKRILFTNFLIGIARGLGYAIGFSLLGAAAVYIIIETGVINSPGIREYLRNML